MTGKYRNTEDLRDDTRFTLGSAGPRYRARYWHEVQFEQVARLQTYFADRDISITHAAIAWVLAQEGITSAIVGASRASQIEDSLKYSEIDLSEEDLEFCDQPWYEIPASDGP